MKAILIPVILLAAGTGAGVGTAMFLLPPPAAAPEDHAAPPEAHAAAEGSHSAPAAESHEDSGAESHAATDEHGAPAELPYVALPGQFIVPVVEDAEVKAMVVVTLGLEVAAGTEEEAQAQEPRLRAAFLQVLFDHANTGGFSGMFTAASNMRSLRHGLLAAAGEVLGADATDVLILDLLRQDL